MPASCHSVGLTQTNTLANPQLCDPLSASGQNLKQDRYRKSIVISQYATEPLGVNSQSPSTAILISNWSFCHDHFGLQVIDVEIIHLVTLAVCSGPIAFLNIFATLRVKMTVNS